MNTKDRLEERNFIIECIKLYESLPALWNTKSEIYSDRDKKNEQYQILLRKYRERYTDAVKSDLTKKFNSLRTNFRKKYKKKGDSKTVASGDSSETTLWYYDHMKFLINIDDNDACQNSMADDGEVNEAEPAMVRISDKSTMITSKERQFWVEFLELYKSKPELWKIKCEDYKNRAKKNAAYNALIEKCKEMEPTANKEFVTRKINSMRSTYRRELRKVQNLNSVKEDNNEYVPALWYYQLLDFLKDQEETAEGECVLDSDNEKIDGEQQKEIEPRPKKKKTNSSTDELVRLATQRLKFPQDSCTHIGIVWGNKLSKMDRNQRIIAEKVINEVMFNAELGLLNFNTSLTNISSVCNLNPTSSSFSKNHTIINTSESSLESTPTNNYGSKYSPGLTPTEIVRQRFSTDILNYASPSPPMVRIESIIDNENQPRERNYVVAEFDPLDNSIKIEN